MQISFFDRSIVEQNHLKFSINISVQRVRGMQVTTGTVKQNYKESVKRLLSFKNAYSLTSSVKGMPAYWKHFIFEVLAMLKQLGIPRYFLTLLCADLRWGELPYIINKLKNLGFSDEELKNLFYQERTKLLNENPVLEPRHFQYKAQVFFNEFMLDGPFCKTKYYALCMEFQEREIPHVYAIGY